MPSSFNWFIYHLEDLCMPKGPNRLPHISLSAGFRKDIRVNFLHLSGSAYAPLMFWWELKICYTYHFFKEMFHKDTYQMQKLYICLDRDLPSKNCKWLGPLIQNLMWFYKFIHAMIGYLFLNIRHTWPHLTHFNPQQIPLFQFLWPHMTPFPLFLTTIKYF